MYLDTKSLSLRYLTLNSMKENDWFATWFDTKYYHLLYQDRDDVEAKNFIENLSRILTIPSDSKVLDLACGKGRHSIVLNSLGYDVVGYDLSEESIHDAQKHENDRLKFSVHDMRQPFSDGQFQSVFNLFTSFGYFNSIADNTQVLTNIKASLKPKGYLVIDFMNVKKVIQSLVPIEEKIIDGIRFCINRSYSNSHITKRIDVLDDGNKLRFEESVQTIDLDQFTHLLTDCDFDIIRTFGDFTLSEFDEKESDRLIIIAQKKT